MEAEEEEEWLQALSKALSQDTLKTKVADSAEAFRITRMSEKAVHKRHKIIQQSSLYLAAHVKAGHISDEKLVEFLQAKSTRKG